MTRRSAAALAAGAATLLLLLPATPVAGSSAAPAEPAAGATDLRPVSDFAAIAAPEERAVALFAEAGKVLLHPRCINCHPAGDAPLQGEDGRPHQPPVVRGTAGQGVVGMRCGTCHLEANFDPGGVPGAHGWHLAPHRMAWEGLSLGQLCEQIQDPERNGGRTLDQIVEHMAEDELVAWGWEPGAGREPAPGSQQAFGELIRAWVEAGAACPQANR